ncbi:MAG: polysaccharide biosynthesis C-terminal domain-containing protein, partial [Firmicutes bacterium]|nr:polysaccharide biosynthesis C-terminal domain-containing protein [Bacillota bacterium]
VDYGTQYLRICLIMGFGIFGQMTFERLLQSTGKSIYSMITQGTGAIINLILDPIMIFGYFGFPKMGVAGAALATVTGQIIAMILGIIFNIKYNKEINFSFKGFRPDGKIIKRIYSVGIPAMIMQAIGSVMTYSMNKILLMFSPTAVAVFGVYFKLQSFIFMPVFGLNNGVIPIVAYNYGIRNKKRIMDTIKLSMIVAVAIMIFGVIVFETIPDKLLLIFDASEDMIKMGTVALRIIGLHFVLAGFSIIIMSVFQAFGEGMISLVVSVSRQLVVLIPVAYIFAKLFGLDYVWFSFPIAEIVALTLCIVFFRRLYNKKIKNLND